MVVDWWVLLLEPLVSYRPPDAPTVMPQLVGEVTYSFPLLPTIKTTGSLLIKTFEKQDSCLRRDDLDNPPPLLRKS